MVVVEQRHTSQTEGSVVEDGVRGAGRGARGVELGRGDGLDLSGIEPGHGDQLARQREPRRRTLVGDVKDPGSPLDDEPPDHLRQVLREGGTAVLVYALTENRNRTVAEVRNAFNRNGGNMGENGCVDWLFEAKGVIEVELEGHDPDELSLEAIDLGADDVEPVEPDHETLTIYTDPGDLEKIRQGLEAKKYKVVKAETTMLPKTKIELTDEKVAHQVMRLVEKLEDLDDVQNVYSNADFPEAFAASFTS